MFCFEDSTVEGRILSVADGPSTFNLEMRAAGFNVTSVDLRYRLDKAEILDEFEKSYAENRDYFYEHPEDFSFKTSRDIEALLAARRSTFHLFLQDFDENPTRYVFGELPKLQFADDSFDVCLCANLLFLFDDLLDIEFHLKSIYEMLRVSRRVQVFPVYGRGHLPVSCHLQAVLQKLAEIGIHHELKPSRYKVWNGESAYLTLNR